MLHLEGMRGFSISYLGYIKATVRIPQIKDYEECVTMLVLKSFSPFSLRAPVQLGTTVLDWAMANLLMLVACGNKSIRVLWLQPEQLSLLSRKAVTFTL